MTSYSTNEFKVGLKIIMDGDPWVILENEFVKPGKGQAFNRVKVRNLKTDRVLEKTFKSGETVVGADVQDLDLQYLYNDGAIWHFMDNKTFEQYEVDGKILGDAKLWLKEQSECMVTLWNGSVIVVTPPNFVVFAVTATDPGLRGDTVTGGTKPATLESGAVVKVPLFIEVGDLIKVDTRTKAYVSRAK